MRQTLRTLLAILVASAALSSYSAPAVFDLPALSSESGGVYVVDVREVVNPGWRDEAGHGVMLAVTSVEKTLKGPQRVDLTFSFKPTISDQPRFGKASRYVVFVFGQQRPIILDHQPRAFPIHGGLVETAGLKGEPQTQPLEPFIARIR